MPDNVRFARGGIEYIKSKTDNVFNNEEMVGIVEKIESGRLERGFKTNRQHIKHVRDIVEEKPDIQSCSKCGADMVIRRITKGKNFGNEFFGCSAFPKCKNTIKAC